MSVYVPEQANGHAPAEPPRVRFGDLPNHTLPLDWAEQFIRIVYTEYAHVFRAILPRLYELPEPEPKRGRKGPQGAPYERD